MVSNPQDIQYRELESGSDWLQKSQVSSPSPQPGKRGVDLSLSQLVPTCSPAETQATLLLLTDAKGNQSKANWGGKYTGISNYICKPLRRDGA